MQVTKICRYFPNLNPPFTILMIKKTKQFISAQKGILFMLLSSLCFALMSALAKDLNQIFPSIELVLFRNIIGLPFLIGSIIMHPTVQKGGRLGFLIYRGFLGAFTLYCLFYALEHLGLSLTNTYGQAFPLFIAIFTFIWVPKERLSGRQVFFLLMGFYGILLIFQPDASVSWQKHSIGVMYAVGTALGYMAIKEAQNYYDSRWVIFSFMAAGFTASSISLILGTQFDFAPNFWIAKWVQPQGLEWLKVVCLGLLALGVQSFTTQALRHEKTSVVGAVGNSSVLFSILIEIAIGNGMPTWLGLMGMGLVLLGSYQVSRK
jgi:drug/metabolite transporter (DMT)-like permease